MLKARPIRVIIGWSHFNSMKAAFSGTGIYQTSMNFIKLKIILKKKISILMIVNIVTLVYFKVFNALGASGVRLKQG